VGTEVPSLGIRRPEPESDHSPPSSGDAKTTRSVVAPYDMVAIFQSSLQKAQQHVDGRTYSSVNFRGECPVNIFVFCRAANHGNHIYFTISCNFSVITTILKWIVEKYSGVVWTVFI
jgi:hypothetical protein